MFNVASTSAETQKLPHILMFVRSSSFDFSSEDKIATPLKENIMGVYQDCDYHIDPEESMKNGYKVALLGLSSDDYDEMLKCINKPECPIPPLNLVAIVFPGKSDVPKSFGEPLMPTVLPPRQRAPPMVEVMGKRFITKFCVPPMGHGRRDTRMNERILPTVGSARPSTIAVLSNNGKKNNKLSIIFVE